MNTSIYSDKARVLAATGTRLAIIAGYPVYEHPVHGDEWPVLIIAGGEVISTDFYDIPTAEELLDFVNVN